MKITIIGGGNMGSAIALGLASGNYITASDITVINRRQEKADELKSANNKINSVSNDYSSISNADIIVLGVKPWMIEDVLTSYKDKINNRQIILSVAAGITLDQLSGWTYPASPVYRVIPNTAIAIKQSMTFVASKNATKQQDDLIISLLNELGKTLLIEEKLFPAVTSLSSCGIAYAFRYIRAAMEGGVEIGVKADQAKEIVMQTLQGAIDLLAANQSHPESEIDKVTTPGGITIKGLNEMEHAGFTSAVIKGLKASNVK
ncbi:pyrroline-5-carboxylate reductase [Dysgonomonas capnocytophagoides]|uniref:pyrroline-5-carboxylate reductase n=1 Tax=Dysgonomonas capnocytophagoides TaxID=45254 RepID=UPI0029257336|nr:pyrroline-5-carboxylate reductase [Dysgonomonas capnocytophagoides]